MLFGKFSQIAAVLVGFVGPEFEMRKWGIAMIEVHNIIYKYKA